MAGGTQPTQPQKEARPVALNLPPDREIALPACYSGRWPHIHFEVYTDLEAATDEANKIATSQIALPEDACDLVYATDGCSQSISNMGRVSLASDNVFGDDGGIHELGTITGDVPRGMTVTLSVPVRAA